jgi:hypothetical protein
LPDKILVKIHPGLFEEPKPGDIKVFQIVPMPYNLQRVQVMESHAHLNLVAHSYPANSTFDIVLNLLKFIGVVLRTDLPTVYVPLFNLDLNSTFEQRKATTGRNGSVRRKTWPEDLATKRISSATKVLNNKRQAVSQSDY